MHTKIKFKLLMRHYLLLLFISLSVISCKKGDKFTISGDAKGVKDGTEVVLQKQDSTGLVRIDTVKVKGGKFEFEGKAGEPYMHVLFIKELNGGFPVVIEPGDIHVTVDKDSLFKSKMGGTLSNDDLNAYMNDEIKFQHKVIAFRKANGEKYQQAMMAKDTVTTNALDKENKKFQKEYEALSFNHIEKNPKSLISLVLLGQFVSNPTTDMAKIEKLYNGLDAELKTYKQAKKIETAIKAYKKTAMGQKAPDFTAPDPTGKGVTLSASLGKVTIVDFWASWCRPCRDENPNMVALYNEFHEKGLNIIGVSLDQNKEAWLKAIKDDQLSWIEVSNLKNWQDPIAKAYSVQQIPATFVLDSKGNIVAKDLSGAALKAKVAELLGAAAGA